jgi:hypothetical protein
MADERWKRLAEQQGATGGADPIHKLMDPFRKFMEASSARASGPMK